MARRSAAGTGDDTEGTVPAAGLGEADAFTLVGAATEVVPGDATAGVTGAAVVAGAAGWVAAGSSDAGVSHAVSKIITGTAQNVKKRRRSTTISLYGRTQLAWSQSGTKSARFPADWGNIESPLMMKEAVQEMAVYRQNDHEHVAPVTRETTVVREGGSGAGVLIGIVVALVIIGLIAWALLSSGLFNGPTVAPAGEPNAPNINVDINQPSGGAGTGNGAAPANEAPVAPNSGAQQSGPSGGGEQPAGPSGR